MRISSFIRPIQLDHKYQKIRTLDIIYNTFTINTISSFIQLDHKQDFVYNTFAINTSNMCISSCIRLIQVDDK